VDDLEGDEGLAPLIDQRPDAVLDVPVPGEMPDVDTTADLARLRPLPHGD
jgi:CTP:molybdopterin cytidylyltransferase MocA